MEDYLDTVAAVLEPHGFDRSATLAAVSICRDELTQNLITHVTHRWGPTFALGGLGGLPSLGRTGWGACLAHVPTTAERGKLLVIAAPHIGVERDGSVGHNLRRGQSARTATCGALGAVFETWGEHPPAGPNETGLADQEAQLLRRLVEAELDETPGDIIELTNAATSAVERETMAQLDSLAPWDEMDVAVFTAVQIHLQLGGDRMMPVNALLRGRDGSTTTLIFP